MMLFLEQTGNKDNLNLHSTFFPSFKSAFYFLLSDQNQKGSKIQSY